jgi:hypothetical protein
LTLARERLEQYGDAFQRWGVPDVLRAFAITLVRTSEHFIVDISEYIASNTKH